MIATGVYRKAMREIEEKKGDFTLFALLMRRNALGKWDLVVAAPWIEGGTLRATREIVELLTESIGSKPLLQLARVVPVDTGDTAVKFILANLPVEGDSELRVRSTDLFGLEIEDAIILRAKHPASNGARRLRSSAEGSTRLHR